MAHFAKLNNANIVVDVVVVPDEHEHRGSAFLASIGFPGNWVQTSYNATFGRKFAGRGDVYFPVEGIFREQAPFPTWIWSDEEDCWMPPVPFPNDGKDYTWDDSSVSWILEESLLTKLEVTDG